MQARLIAQIFSQEIARQGMILKGGLAMRAVFGSTRSTKDIDLDATPRLGLLAIQRIVRKAASAATADGMLTNLVVSEPKQTGTTARWKINGDLPGGGHMHLTVEVSHRGDADLEQAHALPYTPDPATGVRPGQPITVYRADAMALRKLEALMSEHRDAPRDVVDLAVLIEAGVVPNVERLAAWMDQHGPTEHHVARLWEKLDAMDWARFQAEVTPSLAPAIAARFTESHWEGMRLTVGQEVQKWLELAPIQRRLRAGAPS